MKNKLAKLLLEISGLLVVLSIVVVCLEKKYAPYKTEPDETYGSLERKKDSIQFVYLGSSHMGTFGSYHPDSTIKVRNLAFQGLDLFREFVLLKKWVPQMHSLQGVVLCVDYETIGQNQTLSGEPHLDRQFFPYTDTLYKNDFTNRLLCQSNFFRSNRDLRFLTQKQEVKQEKEEKNFIPMESREKLTDYDCNKRAKEHSDIKFNKAWIAENQSYLKAIIQICKQHHLQLYVFNPPKSTCFKEHSNQANVALAKAAIYQTLNEEGVHYYDYYSDPAFSDSDLADYDHLSRAGAIKVADAIFAR